MTLLRMVHDAAPDVAARADARESLVAIHLPLVRHIAKSLARRSDEVADLVQVGVIGLLNAIDRFDPTRGFEFTTFAVPTITGEIRRSIRDTGWLVHVPRRAKELQRSVRCARDSLTQDLQREPTCAEIAALLGIPAAHAREAIDAASSQSTVSVDSSAADAPMPLVDSLSVSEAGFDQVELRVLLRPALATLPMREREILMLRFVRNRTQNEIAKTVGVSQMQVSRLIARGLGHLRDALEPAGPPARMLEAS
jgi:RNA polymerase sigma-B factor